MKKMKATKQEGEPQVVILGKVAPGEKDRQDSRKERKGAHARLMERAVEAASAFPMVELINE